MERTVIIDIVVAAVLFGFLFVGARRGLFRSVMGLAVVVIALVGANLASDTLTPVAAGFIQPTIEKRVEKQLQEAMERDTEFPEIDDESVIGELLTLLHIDKDPAAAIMKKAREQIEHHGTTVVTAVAMSVASSTLRMALFLVGFLVILLVLKLLVNALNLVLKLPVLNQANALGGAAVGLIEGALALFVVIWILRRFGVSFDTATVSDTVLLRFFATHTPLSVLS